MQQRPLPRRVPRFLIEIAHHLDKKGRKKEQKRTQKVARRKIPGVFPLAGKKYRFFFLCREKIPGFFPLPGQKAKSPETSAKGKILRIFPLAGKNSRNFSSGGKKFPEFFLWHEKSFPEFFLWALFGSKGKILRIFPPSLLLQRSSSRRCNLAGH